MSKQEYFDFMISSSIVESKKIDLLTMGRPEGPGCYCYVNSILRRCIDRLSDKYKYIVIDCEAGLEHLSRRTTINIDYFFIISNISIKGVKVANEILNLIENLKTVAKKKILIFNRIGNEKEEKVIEELLKHIDINKFDYIGKIPEDKSVFNLEMKEESIINLPDDSLIFLSFVDIINKI
jgi:CO dehydrogenase maturation factor